MKRVPGPPIKANSSYVKKYVKLVIEFDFRGLTPNFQPYQKKFFLTLKCFSIAYNVQIRP